MVRMPWATYLWPGLPQLWRQGLWSGLALAVGLAVCSICSLMASFVWVELLSPGDVAAGVAGDRSLWIGCGGSRSAWYGWGVDPRRANSAEAMFREALSEYLQGNWFEAERILAGCWHATPATSRPG